MFEDKARHIRTLDVELDKDRVYAIVLGRVQQLERELEAARATRNGANKGNRRLPASQR